MSLILTETEIRSRSTRSDIKFSAEAFARWGCSWDQYLKIRGEPAYRFRLQKGNAKSRGIAWELNLWQWWSIWQESGHWPERGIGKGYAMCRNGDVGPYAVGNVYIATNSQNVLDRWSNERAALQSGETY